MLLYMDHRPTPKPPSSEVNQSAHDGKVPNEKASPEGDAEKHG